MCVQFAFAWFCRWFHVSTQHQNATTCNQSLRGLAGSGHRLDVEQRWDLFIKEHKMTLGIRSTIWYVEWTSYPIAPAEWGRCTNWINYIRLPRKRLLSNARFIWDTRTPVPRNLWVGFFTDLGSPRLRHRPCHSKSSWGLRPNLVTSKGKTWEHEHPRGPGNIELQVGFPSRTMKEHVEPGDDMDDMCSVSTWRCLATQRKHASC